MNASAHTHRQTHFFLLSFHAFSFSRAWHLDEESPNQLCRVGRQMSSRMYLSGGSAGPAFFMSCGFRSQNLLFLVKGDQIFSSFLGSVKFEGKLDSCILRSVDNSFVSFCKSIEESQIRGGALTKGSKDLQRSKGVAHYYVYLHQANGWS